MRLSREQAAGIGLKAIFTELARKYFAEVTMDDCTPSVLELPTRRTAAYNLIPGDPVQGWQTGEDDEAVRQLLAACCGERGNPETPLECLRRVLAERDAYYPAPAGNPFYDLPEDGHDECTLE